LRCIGLVDLERVMTALELAVLIGIVAAFTGFAAVLAWVTWAQGGSSRVSRAIPARVGMPGQAAKRVEGIRRATSV